MISPSVTTSLRETLRAGLSIFQEVWHYQARDWITSIHAADINNDGYLEIITCSRDGRVRAFDKDRRLLWRRVVGSKAWIGAIAGIEGTPDNPACILVGTRDGKVFAFTQDGKTVGKDGKLYAFDPESGRALNREAEIASCWLNTTAPIRQVFVDTARSPYVIVGSEDGYVYALNIHTRVQHWAFHTDGWVRAIYHSDIDGDGRVETLIGSHEKMLFVVSEDGQLLQHLPMTYPIHAVFAADVDQDGETEILVATDGKDLMMFSPTLHQKWSCRFDNRILALSVADINRDGQLEIIAGSEDKHVYILNQYGEQLWRHFMKSRVISVYTADIDNDGQIEILVGASNDHAYAFKVELIDNLEKRIRAHYQALRRNLKVGHNDLTQFLATDELGLLHDILREEGQQREQMKHLTLQDVDRLSANGQHYDALVALLKLEQSRVQVQLRKGKQHHLENIRSLCISHTARTKSYIVVGTNDGDVHIFTVKGKRVRTLNLGERILDIQTGYATQKSGECLIICTSSHKVYIISSIIQGEKYQWEVGYETACIYVNNGNRQCPSEIFTGSAANIRMYEDDFQIPSASIQLQEEIDIIHAYTRAEQEISEIIVGNTNRSIYAYTRKGALLWNYEVWDRVRSLDMKDIDRDGEVELIVGSEDRNVHVLDSHGKLRWRFFLPHTVQAVQAIDIDHDDQIEILAGCADGWLYVFSKDGDLRWKYRASDRIRTLKAADIDNDGNIEIVIGAEDELEIISVIDQQRVRERIEKCLVAIQKEQSLEDIYRRILHPNHARIFAYPELRAFAIARLARLPNVTPEVFTLFEDYLKDNDANVRKAVLQAVVACYTLDASRATQLLNQFLQDGNTTLEIKLAFIELMPTLMGDHWQLGFTYLEYFFAESDRLLRRAVVRQLDRLIHLRCNGTEERMIFDLLMKAARDSDSKWICQEAARTLAHFLDNYREGLIIYMHLFLVNELPSATMSLIGHYSRLPLVQKFILAVMPFFEDLNRSHIPNHLYKVVDVLQDMTKLEYGKDTLRIYEEFLHLFTLTTIDGIAAYQCSLTHEDFRQDNSVAQVVMDVLKQVRLVCWHCGIYLRRNSIFDRLTSLIDTQKELAEVLHFVERAYSGSLMQRPMMRLPDHLLLVVLLQRWQEIIREQIDELRGVIELTIELQTKTTRYEEQVAVLFKISNTGRRVADNVKVSLLHSTDFDVISNVSVEIETLLSYEERYAEFTIKLSNAYLRKAYAGHKPQKEGTITCIQLCTEVAYRDEADRLQTLSFQEKLELCSVLTLQNSTYIPNNYSTGSPFQTEPMFYGRDHDVAALRHSLAENAAQTIILLYGQRRTGKTTLLQHLARTSVLDRHIPVFIDMQREAYNISVSNLLYHLAQDIARVMISRGSPIHSPEMHEYALDPTFVFDGFLREVESSLRGQKLIILIDEFEVLEDQIIKGRLSPEFIDYLRSIMQHHNVNFLLAGTHQLDQLKQANWEVFFNIARQYRLSKLSSQGAEDLIRQPVKDHLEYGPFAVEKIRQLTADQPYLIHLLCRTLVDQCNNQRKVYATINDVNTAKCEALQICAPHFAWLWDQLSSDEQLLLAVIANLGKEDGRWVSYGEIAEHYCYYHLPYERKNLQSWIKALELGDIIEIITDHPVETSFPSERVRVPAGLARLWLLKEKPLMLLVER